MEIQRFLERRKRTDAETRREMGREKRQEARIKETALKAAADMNAVGVGGDRASVEREISANDLAHSKLLPFMSRKL